MGSALLYLVIFSVVFGVSLLMDIRSNSKGIMPTVKSSLAWTLVWILVSVGFAGVTWALLGPEKAGGYFVGWLMEKTLAVDNLFAFMAVFGAFGLAGHNSHFQHRILHWGIIGAIGIRALLLAGIGVLLSLEGIWHTAVMLGLGASVLLMAFLMTKEAFKRNDSEEHVDYTKHWSVRLTSMVLPIVPEITSGKFFVKMERNGKLRWHATPLFLCLVCIEMVDVGFAFDSMPAIAAVVRDPLIMWTSTMMAVAGLRALYFALLGASNVLCHLDKAVAGLLFWIAFKVAADALHLVHIPNSINLVVICLFLAIGVGASICFPEKKRATDPEHDPSNFVEDDEVPIVETAVSAERQLA